MNWTDRIVAAHLAVTDAVSHGQRMQSDRYFVWQEDGANALQAENTHAEQSVTGTTDLFTKQELDPWAADLEASLSGYQIAWYLNSVQFEEDTGFWHYEWVWEVA